MPVRLVLGAALLATVSIVVAVRAEDPVKRPPERDRTVVLGRAPMPAGTAISLYSVRDAAGPCLRIAGLPGGTRGCGRAPSERVPPARRALGGGAIVRRTAHAPLELYGEARSNVRRVVLRYRLPRGDVGEREATLIRVTDRAVLQAARIRRPFGYFVGVVPARARRVFAVALDGSGEEAGRLGYDRLARSMHPRVFIAIPSR